jgi:hypothetical protein
MKNIENIESLLVTNFRVTNLLPARRSALNIFHLRGDRDRFVLKSDCRQQILQNL